MGQIISQIGFEASVGSYKAKMKGKQQLLSYQATTLNPHHPTATALHGFGGVSTKPSNLYSIQWSVWNFAKIQSNEYV